MSGWRRYAKELSNIQTKALPSPHAVTVPAFTHRAVPNGRSAANLHGAPFLASH